MRWQPLDFVYRQFDPIVGAVAGKEVALSPPSSPVVGLEAHEKRTKTPCA